MVDEQGNSQPFADALPGGNPITPAMLATLTERYGERWKIWPSAQGRYACATLCRGLSWVRSQGHDSVGFGGAYVRTLVTDSPEELATAIEQENKTIAHLLAEHTLKRNH